MNENELNTGSFTFARALEYQKDNENYKNPYDSYCKPLKWYLDLYCKYSNNEPNSISELEHKMNKSQGVLTKRLNPSSKQHSRLNADEIEEICSNLKTPLSVILYLYEHQSIIQENGDLKNSFDDIIFLLTDGLGKTIENARIFRGFSENGASKYAFLEASTDNNALERWEGRWYFYFPSSDSKIVGPRKKKIRSSAADPTAVDEDLRELFALYSDDHIFCGTLDIYEREGKFAAKLQYLTNPRRPVIARMDGSVSISQHNRTIFITPTTNNDEIVFIIVHATNDDPEAEYAAASVLTLSKNREIKRRRPCSMRMILSRKPIATESRIYKKICAELMMNDDIIRIDEYGYSELKKNKDNYQSPALDKFLEIYPEIDALENDNRIKVSKCAFIRENLIGSLNDIEDMGESEILYLEALLRFHSLAPWYSKIKAEKSEELELMDKEWP